MPENTENPEITLFRGLPASGKSTEALRWLNEKPDTRVRVSRDDIRFELFNEYSPTATKRSSVKDKENQVTVLEHERIRDALGASKDVGVDNTNLNPRAFKTYSDLAKEFNANLTHKDFPVSLDEAIRRNAARERVVPEEVIRGMYNNYLGPNGEFHLFPGTYDVQPFVKPDHRRHAIIFDMDGTLANVDLIRHFVRGKYRNFDMFHRSSLWSPPHQEVLDMAFDADDAGMAVIIVTARSEPYREVTQAWNDKFNVPYENIYMRPEGDNRQDAIVKAEILQEILVDYDVVHCVDDNPNVAKTWENAGILTTVVPGFHNEDIALEPVHINNMFRTGGCLRCGKPLKSGANIGPRCATKV